jgi:replicative DNA helicase
MNSEILDKLPPSDAVAEQNLLGSIVLMPEILDDLPGLIQPGDFYADAHRKIYEACLALWTSGRVLDTLLLIRHLKDAGTFAAVGEHAYIAEVCHAVAVAAHWRYYATIIVKLARLRALIHAGLDLVQQAYDSATNPEDVLTEAEGALAGIRTGQYQDEPVTAFEAAQEACARVDEIQRRRESAGLLTGVSTLDDKIGGLFPSELTILAARPSQGKTALARQIATYNAAKGRLVYFASLEMAPVDLATLSICAAAGINSMAIRSGRITEDDAKQFSLAAAEYSGHKLVFDRRARFTVADIRRRARRYLADGLRLIVVDYLGLLTPSDKRIDRHLQVGQMTADLKELAREFKVPILCLAQLRRAERGQQLRPTLDQLRESGSIEQDADGVLLLFRPKGGMKTEVKKPSEADPPADHWDAELDVAKQRLGETGAVKLDWHGPGTTFSCHDVGCSGPARERGNYEPAFD